MNVYGPAISTEESAEERYAFKLQFYRVGCCRRSERQCFRPCMSSSAAAWEKRGIVHEEMQRCPQ